MLRDTLQSDFNLQNPRSKLPSSESFVDVVESDSYLPEETNIYRNELVALFKSDPSNTEQEQLIASAAALILTLLRV